MSIFESSNPTLSEKIFNKSLSAQNQGTMTVRGSIQKFGFLLLMVAAGAAYTWKLYYEFKVPTMTTLMWVGLIGGFITGLIITFKPTAAKWLSPAYGLLQGLMLGAFSAIINDSFKVKYPDIVLQAVLLTFAVAFSMFLLYNFRIIKPTQKFKAIIISASVAIAPSMCRHSTMCRSRRRRRISSRSTGTGPRYTSWVTPPAIPPVSAAT